MLPFLTGLRGLSFHSGRQPRVIPFGGVILDKKTVKAHRYLRKHGLPHSSTAANVHI